MNAVERLEAAITKLETLKADAWSPLSAYHLDSRLIVSGDSDDDDAPIIFDLARASSDADGELIVTLHRTIDAQLAILRWAVELYALPNASHPNPLETRALSLAGAILGGDS